MHDDFTTFSMVCSINSLLLLQVEIQVQSELLSVTYWKTTLQGLKLAHIWWKMNSNFKPEMNGMNSGSDKCIRINSQEYENPLTKCIQKIKNAK